MLVLPRHEPLKLKTERAGHHVWLHASQRFVVVDDTDYAGEYKTSTRQYIYWLSESAEGDPTVAWHWHPEADLGKQEPHCHVASKGVTAWGDRLGKLHIPTERTPFELVVRFAIDDLDVRPAREDWREVLDESLRAFRRFRKWPTAESGLASRPAPREAAPRPSAPSRGKGSRPR